MGPRRRAVGRRGRGQDRHAPLGRRGQGRADGARRPAGGGGVRLHPAHRHADPVPHARRRPADRRRHTHPVVSGGMAAQTEQQERSGPLLLLDGMSLAFRAFFALPDTLATKSGIVTNAAHGFTSLLVYLIREQRPSALAVPFDAPGDTFRDEMLEDYKAGRADTPWLLPHQFDIIREVMAALAIPVIEAPGFGAQH